VASEIAVDRDELRSRFRGCLTGVAVGDALGAPFEGAASVSEADWVKIEQDTDRLRFTDDTHMTFGVIESLLASDGFDPDALARIFMRDFEAEPWRGYGAGPPQIFAEIKQGVRWDEPARKLFGGQGSYGNGAAIRVAPIGLRYYCDLQRVADIARRSAALTHAHGVGQDGAALQAVAVAYAVSSSRPLDVGALVTCLSHHTPQGSEFRLVLEEVTALSSSQHPGLVAERIGNGTSALEAVPAALVAFLANKESFAETIRFAVAMAGDTDTIASMAGALSGAYLGESAIPDRWKSRAEGAPSMARLGGILFEETLRERSGA